MSGNCFYTCTFKTFTYSYPARKCTWFIFHVSFFFFKGERRLMGENCVWGKNEEDQQIADRGRWYCRHRAARPGLQGGSWTCLFFVISELMLWSGYTLWLVDFCDRKNKIPIISFLWFRYEAILHSITIYVFYDLWHTLKEKKRTRVFSCASECERVFVRGYECVYARARYMQWKNGEFSKIVWSILCDLFGQNTS